ncbi:MAG TPA: glycosyltransferase family 4 protein [Pyrinomonadaceae bacterium]|nr:glycosyltransferase family 4 protein [Pyrinomonadaceae bacterium]
MKICFVTSEFVTEPEFAGGLANYLGRVSVALRRHGHEVHVVTRAARPGRVDHDGVTVHRVVPLWDERMILDHADPLVPRVMYNTYQDFKSAWCLWRYWRALRREARFDLTQVTNVSATGLFFRFERSSPVVTRLSSYRPVWDTLAGVPVTAGVRARWLMEKVAIRGARTVYAPSHFVADLTTRNYGVRRVDVIESPFFREAVAADESVYEAHAKGLPYLLFFGRMTSMKGVPVLASALKRTMARVPEMHAFFVGPDAPFAPGVGMKQHVRAALAEFGSRVHLLDALRHEQLYPFISHARLVALPSLADNLPNTCLEAMGLGRAVVATKGSCFEQVIKDGESGFLVEPGDAAALSEALEKVWNMTPERLAEVGRRAHEKVLDLHPDRKIPELIRYFEEVVRASSCRATRLGPLPVRNNAEGSGV